MSECACVPALLRPGFQKLKGPMSPQPDLSSKVPSRTLVERGFLSGQREAKALGPALHRGSASRIPSHRKPGSIFRTRLGGNVGFFLVEEKVFLRFV